MEVGGQTRPRDTSRTAGRPPLPSPRPRWVVLLGALMLLWAFHLFTGGLTGLEVGAASLSDPLTSTGPQPVAGSEAAQAALRRALAQAFARVDPGLLRAHAAAKLVLAAVLLFAVAAIAVNDRRGRPAALSAAWTGIVYHLGSAIFFVFVVRAGLMASAPIWIDELEAFHGGTDPARSRQDLLDSASTMLVLFPLAVAMLGIGFFVIVIRFFGGPRGRSFYGGVALEGSTQLPPGA